MQQLQLDEFLRSLKQNIDMPHSLLLGAGASIESGVQSATECIWDWKKEIYLSQNPGAIGNYSNSKLEIVRQVIQKWNSFNLYSKLPCTIESSNQIAQIGWMLSQFEGSLYDYRFFM